MPTKRIGSLRHISKGRMLAYAACANVDSRVRLCRIFGAMVNVLGLTVVHARVLWLQQLGSAPLRPASTTRIVLSRAFLGDDLIPKDQAPRRPKHNAPCNTNKG